MLHALSALMLALSLVVWECTANAIPIQVAQKADAAQSGGSTTSTSTTSTEAPTTTETSTSTTSTEAPTTTETSTSTTSTEALTTTETSTSTTSTEALTTSTVNSATNAMKGTTTTPPDIPENAEMPTFPKDIKEPAPAADNTANSIATIVPSTGAENKVDLPETSEMETAVVSQAGPDGISTEVTTPRPTGPKTEPTQQKGKKTDGILCISSLFALAALATLAVAAAAPAH